jgi:hypothetical protein
MYVCNVGKEKPVPAVIFPFMCILFPAADGQSSRPQRALKCTEFTTFLSICRDNDNDIANNH